MSMQKSFSFIEIELRWWKSPLKIDGNFVSNFAVVESNVSLIFHIRTFSFKEGLYYFEKDYMFVSLKLTETSFKWTILFYKQNIKAAENLPPSVKLIQLMPRTF